MIIEHIIDIVLLSFLMILALSIVRIDDLFAAVMLMGMYSLVSACLFVVMDAVDVAFTEAAVGAGISTLLMLTCLTITGRKERHIRHYPWLALLVVFLAGGLLFYGTLDMPWYGSAAAPANHHVAPHYINQSMQEIGLPNIVTSILASYRGFDTFGEVVVIFTAGIGVMALLSRPQGEQLDLKAVAPMNEHLILKIVTKMLIPLIMLYALYVQFHGDFGPGGGFQAGVIFAAGIIVYAMLFGVAEAKQVVKFPLVQLLSAIGVLIYAAVGILSILNGGHFLDYDFIASDALHGQHYGILFVELGVGITVASVMMIIFFCFVERIAYKGKA